MFAFAQAYEALRAEHLSAEMPPHGHCRFYEQKYPEVDDVVMVKVRQIAEMGGTFEERGRQRVWLFVVGEHMAP